MRDDRPCERRKTFSSFDHEPFHSGSTSGTIQETQEEEEDDIFQEITSTKVQIWNLFFPRDNASMEHWFILKNNVLAVQKRPQNFDHIDVGDK